MDYSKQLIGKTVIVEKDVFIGEDVRITSDYIHIKKHTNIKKLIANCPEKFIVGECSYIGNNNKFTCKSFEAGDYLWLTDGVEIGRGGCNGPNSSVTIGNYCMICENVMINPSEKVEIGDNVGIGTEVHIWTHGSYLGIFDGFPANFAPVKIGNHVWLPARNVVLPGVEIGNNCVIGLGSLVNKNLPSGCLAGGMPVKILKENVYPVTLNPDQKQQIIDKILNIWVDELLPHKNITSVINVKYNKKENSVYLQQTTGLSVLKITEQVLEGNVDDVTEDLRDFLRRRGIKIYNGNPFKSITPTIFNK